MSSKCLLTIPRNEHVTGDIGGGERGVLQVPSDHSALVRRREKTPWINNAERFDAGQALVTTERGEQNTWQLEIRVYGVTWSIGNPLSVCASCPRHRHKDIWSGARVRLCASVFRTVCVRVSPWMCMRAPVFFQVCKRPSTLSPRRNRICVCMD